MIVLLQELVLVACYWKFSHISILHKSCAVAAFALTSWLMLNTLPDEHLGVLPVFSMVFTVLSRIPQINANFQQGHTGQLSAPTWTLNLAGSLARIFTTLEETGDALILWSYILAAIVNVILLAQIAIYHKATSIALSAAKSKKPSPQENEAGTKKEKKQYSKDG
jgi:mannose-P-dolichol utilization defect protein 1